MTLECFSIGEMAPVLLREVEDFLDSQDTGHPFQYPHWAGSRARVMLIREHGKICWLGTFVVQGPLGRRFPWIVPSSQMEGPSVTILISGKTRLRNLLTCCEKRNLRTWMSCRSGSARPITTIPPLPTTLNGAASEKTELHCVLISNRVKMTSLRIFARFLATRYAALNDWEPPSLRPQVRPRSKSFCPSISAWRSARVSHLIPSTTYVATFIG